MTLDSEILCPQERQAIRVLSFNESLRSAVGSATRAQVKKLWSYGVMELWNCLVELWEKLGVAIALGKCRRVC